MEGGIVALILTRLSLNIVEFNIARLGLWVVSMAKEYISCKPMENVKFCTATIGKARFLNI